MRFPHVAYEIYQYYLTEDTRIRIVRHSNDTEEAYLMVKVANNSTHLVRRQELTIKLEVEEAESLINEAKDAALGHGSIRKTRHVVPYDCNLNWEIDVFAADNEGLVIAEIELPNEEFNLAVPSYFREVTNCERYYNHNLARHPFFYYDNAMAGAEAARL